MMPSLAVAAASTSANPFALHWSLYPRTYVAPRIPSGIHVIDGDLTKDVWTQAPWSEDFDDIRGEQDAPPNDRPPASCRTRVKMMWDDDYLYIGALITSDMTVEAHFTERNSPIFQKDSDFEVFIDALGTCHDYKEYEVNALNTVWNLMLDRPYNDGGVEHSGRVAKPGDKDYYDVKKQKSATKIIRGKVNNRQGEATTWSVEIAMAHSDILAHIENGKPPCTGSTWRINFSRVEKQGDINWTWQAQVVWNAATHRFGGNVNMHLPDAWGYLVFGDVSVTAMASHRDSSWPARLAAMNVYYAQHEYYAQHGSFASEMSQLAQFVNQAIVSPFQFEIQTLDDLSDRASTFVVVVKGNLDGRVVTVTDDRLIQVHPSESNGDSQ